MSEKRCASGQCIETIRSGETVVIIDTKLMNEENPLIASMSVEDHNGRLARVKDEGLSVMLGESIHQFDAAELGAYAGTIATGELARLQDGQTITAYADLSPTVPIAPQ